MHGQSGRTTREDEMAIQMVYNLVRATDAQDAPTPWKRGASRIVGFDPIVLVEEFEKLTEDAQPDQRLGEDVIREAFGNVVGGKYEDHDVELLQKFLSLIAEVTLAASHSELNSIR